MWRIGKGRHNFLFALRFFFSSQPQIFFQSIKSTALLPAECQENNAKLCWRPKILVHYFCSLKGSFHSKSLIVDLGATISICSRKSTLVLQKVLLLSRKTLFPSAKRKRKNSDSLDGKVTFDAVTSLMCTIYVAFLCPENRAEFCNITIPLCSAAAAYMTIWRLQSSLPFSHGFYMNLNGLARKMHGACLIRLLSGKMPLNGKKKKLKGPLGTLQKTYLLTYYTLVGNVKNMSHFSKYYEELRVCVERYFW